MANKWAVQNGNWSDGSTWNDGVVPTADDDVELGDYQVTLDTSLIVCKSLSNVDHTGKLLTTSTIKNYTIYGDIHNGGTSIIYSPNNSAYFNFTYRIIGDVYSGNVAVIDGPTNVNYGIRIEINGNAENCIVRADTQWQTRYFDLIITGNYKILGTSTICISSQGTLIPVIDIVGNYIFASATSNRIYQLTLRGDLQLENIVQIDILKINGNIDIRNSGLYAISLDISDLKKITINNVVLYATSLINYPQEQSVANGVQYGMQNEYKGRLQLPPEGAVLKDVTYGDKTGTLEVIALSGATATADNISVVNLTEQEVDRVKNCATVSTVQKCFEEFKE